MWLQQPALGLMLGTGLQWSVLRIDQHCNTTDTKVSLKPDQLQKHVHSMPYDHHQL